MSLALLGAQPNREPSLRTLKWGLLASIGGAVGGIVLWPKHWALGMINGSVVASSAHAVATKQESWKSAGKRLGCHVVATATSLGLPSHPAIGWCAGAVAAELLIDGEGGGLLERVAHKAGLRDGDRDLIEGELVTDPQKALSAPQRKAA